MSAPGALRRSLESLGVRNYRRYFFGQSLSLTGNWVQQVAEAWLVIRLGGSGLAVGLIPALQFLPMLLFTVPAGLAADRLDKRRILLVTQPLMAVPALILFAAAELGHPHIWLIYVLVLVRGSINAVDNPARNSLVSELVGGDRVVNAVSLNSIIVHSARIIGPAIAATLIATVGIAPCFIVNVASFGAMLVALAGMNPAEMHRGRPVGRSPGQIRDGLREVRARPELHVPLAMMAVIGTLSFNFQALLPLLARFTWHGTATTYAFLAASLGAGSVAGAVITGMRNRVTPRLLIASAAVFGVGCLAAAAAPTVAAQAALLLFVGGTSVTFAAATNSSLQLAAGPEMRGRVMALYAIVFLGTTPIGSPLVGWLADQSGARSGLVLAGVAALITAYGALYAYRRVPEAVPPESALA